MTVTVEKLIQWLQTQPQDAIVEVTTREGGLRELGEADLQEYGEYASVLDLRGNPLITPDKPYFGKVYVRFGDA